jgi:proline dehydrogenase
MLEALPRSAFALLAGSAAVKRLASKYGMRQPTSFARRFIAGETVAEAIDAARSIERQGFLVTLDVLGESATSTAAAADATRAYVSMIGELERAGVARNVSLKLTQLGLVVDRATSIDNLRRVLDVANLAGFFVRIDMEGSAHTELTFETFETVWNIGYRNVGVVVQAALRRSEQDVRRLNCRRRSPPTTRRSSRPRSRSPSRADSAPTGSSSRCSTAFAAICRRGSPARGIR